MDIAEILKLRKEIDDACLKLGEAMADAEVALDQLSDCINDADNANRDLSEEEFAKWIEIGFRVGAKFRIDGSDVAQPVTVTGISSEGFIITTADGTKYPIYRRYLKLLDRFHLVPDNDSAPRVPAMGDAWVWIKALQEYMLKNNITQDELAERLQVSPATVGKWFLGHNGITRRNRNKIRILCDNFPEEEAEE